MNRPGELSDAQKAAIRRGEEIARRAREGQFQRGVVRGAPPNRPTYDGPEGSREPHPSRVNLPTLRRLTDGVSGYELIQFFLIKVEGECDSDAFVQYTEADMPISECWHAFTENRPVFDADMREAFDWNDAHGVPQRSNESLFWYLRVARGFRGGRILEVLDLYVREPTMTSEERAERE